MGALDDVKVEIVVGKDRAAHRSYADRSFPKGEFVDAFGDNPVENAVAASRTEAERDILQAFGSSEKHLH